MADMFAKIVDYFSYDFVRYAMIVGILVSVCAALFGVILVLKRFSFIGDGLSHVAFGAMAIAAVAGVSDKMVIIMPVTILTAILLLGAGKNAKVKGESSVAMVSVGAMALGYLVMSAFSSSSNVAGDVCGSLFGSFSILTLTKADMILCISISAIVLVFFVLAYNRMFAVTFDEDFSKATGVRAALNNLVIAVITAVIIVLAQRLVGSLLVSALLIFPALSAMRVARSFRSTVIVSVIISVACSSFGILASILLSTPVGPTVVCADIIAFGICFAAGKILKR
ncbi:MAG: metal ABC transporter permease [Clostridia bacterium]|nr:metal ABC transporter permease [Clostridia bacterium]